ncbi:MFS transporter [Amycolatopsis sp.]|uniref:MFS transporter n=1 Tax=Amycolatopsis sp. TaxID=37632 RepID=UPI002CB7472F|nr:MFS transporter [Amycolatopsis sp.]HVV07827.1 MFS transporter [Amycolatopsis sp.]
MGDGEAKRARAGVSVVFAVCGASFATWASRVPAVQQQAGASTGELAIALFGLAAGSVLALAAAGPLITKIGSRRAAVLGVLVLGTGLGVVVLAHDVAALTAALIWLGVGNSVLDVSMNAHAARVEDRYGRPIFAGFHAFWNIGGLVGSGVSALAAAARVPVAVHFPAAGLVALTVGLCAVLTRFFTTPDTGQGGPALVRPGRVLLPLGVIAFCGFVAEGAVNDWSAVYLTDIGGASGSAASLGYFAFSSTMIFIRLIADRTSDRVGAARLMRVAAAVTAGGFVLLAAVPQPAVGVAGFAVLGLGVAAIVPLAWSAAGRARPEAPAMAISAVATCGYLGFLVGPVLIGGLAGVIGLRLAMLTVAALACAVYSLAPSVRAGAPGTRARTSRR